MCYSEDDCFSGFPALMPNMQESTLRPYSMVPARNQMPIFPPLTQSPYGQPRGDMPVYGNRQMHSSIYTVRAFPLAGRIELGGAVIPHPKIVKSKVG